MVPESNQEDWKGKKTHYGDEQGKIEKRDDCFESRGSRKKEMVSWIARSFHPIRGNRQNFLNLQPTGAFTAVREAVANHLCSHGKQH